MHVHFVLLAIKTKLIHTPTLCSLLYRPFSSLRDRRERSLQGPERGRREALHFQGDRVQEACGQDCQVPGEEAGAASKLPPLFLSLLWLLPEPSLALYLPTFSLPRRAPHIHSSFLMYILVSCHLPSPVFVFCVVGGGAHGIDPSNVRLAPFGPKTCREQAEP